MKYHFIGIGGIGMSGLAKILLDRGDKVSGSDLAQNKQTEDLKAAGATIFHGHAAENIDQNIDTVVITSAIRESNPELMRAREINLNVISRAQLLNEIISEQKSIAITGTHGKTTTSSMITTILEEAGMDPTAVIGAEVKRIEGNSKHGSGEYSVAEVCEYQRAFLDIYPFAAVITNIEADHLDCYKDLDDIIAAFAEFVTHINPNGFLVIDGEDENVKKAIKGYKGKLYTYGFGKENDYHVDLTEVTDHKTEFTVGKGDTKLGTFEISVPGKHNVLDALAAIVIADILGVNPKVIKHALANFSGASRRFQLVGEKDGVIYYEDYGHHPTEVAATLEGARQFYPDNRIVAVFQPHQHSRTKLLMEDFAKAFSKADVVLVPEIYAVRDTEEDIKNVSSKELVEKINRFEGEDKATYFKNFEAVEKFLPTELKSNDVAIMIGAGPVNKIAKDILGFPQAV